MPFVTINDAERQLVAYANTQPALLALLYELDYLPEQVTKTEDRVMMLRIISVFALGASVEREASARIVLEECCARDDCEHECGYKNAAVAIRARGKG